MGEDPRAEDTGRRQQILDAALTVFGTLGFHRATNKDIARAAGISPGLIYWYFKDKQDLFFTLFQERTQIFQVVGEPERLMGLPPHEALALLGRSFLVTLRVPNNVALFRMMLGEVARFPELGEMMYRMVASRVFGAIGAYFDHQIALGNMRPHDTAIAARSFIGMFIVQVIAREIFHQPQALATSDEQIVATVVDIFLQGLDGEAGHALTDPADRS